MGNCIGSENDDIRADKKMDELDDLKDKSNTRLLQEIEEMVAAEVDEIDTDKIERYLVLLQSRAPVMEDYNPTAQWKKLKEGHPLLFEEDEPPCVPARGKKRFTRKPRWEKASLGLHTAEIAVAAMLVLVVSVNAFGVNPVTSVWNWGKGVIQSYSNPSGLMELPADDPSEYHSLAAALEANGINPKACPNWVPRDYALGYVNVRYVEDTSKYSATFKSERGDLLVRVVRSANSQWAAFEESEDEGTLYTHNEVEYRIVLNYDNCKAEWNIGNCSFLISGQISEMELKQMIDSIDIRSDEL